MTAGCFILSDERREVKLAGERKSLGETVPASRYFLDVVEEPVHCGEVKEAGVGHGGGRRESLE